MAFRQIQGGEGASVWIEAPNSKSYVWSKGTLLSQSGALVTVRVKGAVNTYDIRTVAIEEVNPKVEADMTALHFINEPGILFNLEQRCETDEPYTFMGNVLVAVNPLKRIPDPIKAGSPNVIHHPHPYAVAEGAYQQMSFACDNRRVKATNLFDMGNQSVITGGESGAGKTESSKMVLRHLVQRTMQKKSSGEIDRRLLGSNPITEAFGNAATLRNHNSSRFGKFMKLHFKQVSTPNDKPASWQIVAGSVDTYLLERSRVTLHGEGERNFHVFYQLLAGGGSMVNDFGLNLSKDGFHYLKATESFASNGSRRKGAKTNDKADFKELQKALLSIGISDEESKSLFQVVAGIMHLGNALFVNKETTEGDVAIEGNANSGYSGLEYAAKMFGISKSSLENLITTRIVKARREVMTVHRNARAAMYARDAVAKGMYSMLFDHVIARIDRSLDDSGTEHGNSLSELPFIGVLDIFGFESFERNGFEQLLINFTNEALQKTFNQSVFVGELKLYQDEGLVLDEEMEPPPDNSATMELLIGAPGNSDSYARAGLLMTIVMEGENIQPNDVKMNDRFHRVFNKHPSFIKPHPKSRSSTFIIFHYAGKVKYTVGNFLEKNNDRLPDDVANVLSESSVSVVQNLFAGASNGKTRSPYGKKSAHQSVVTKFRGQINDLVETLESTRCSFIRCVKPNPQMERAKGWFDLKYISQQLRCLSIPQTAEVLKAGLPTRISYSSLVESYRTALDRKTIAIWKQRGGGNEKMFVAALFWAFEVERSTYKLGHTRVFFRSGKLAKLDHIMQAAAGWMSGNDKANAAERKRIGKRFRLYYIRMMWRQGYIKALAVVRFRRIMFVARKRQQAALLLQSFCRMVTLRIKYLRKIKKLRMERAKSEKRVEPVVDSTEEPAELAESTDLSDEKYDEELHNQVNAERTESEIEEEKQIEENELEHLRDAVAEVQEAKDSGKPRNSSFESHNQRLAKVILDEADYMVKRNHAHESKAEQEAAKRRYIDEYAREMAKFEVARIQREKAIKVFNDFFQAGFDLLKPENIKKAVTKARDDWQRRNDEIAAWWNSVLSKGARLFTQEGLKEVFDEWKYMERKYRLRYERRNREFLRAVQDTSFFKQAKQNIEYLTNLPVNKTASIGKAVSKDFRTVFRVSDAEKKQPVLSAQQLINNFKSLLQRGKLTPDEFAENIKMVRRIAEKRDSDAGSRSRRPQAESDYGKQVFCKCGKVGNTLNGPTCGFCGEPLVPDEDDDRKFWEEIHYKGGIFKACFDGAKLMYLPFDDEETVVFSIECVWLGKTEKQWSITPKFSDVAALDQAVHKKLTKRLFNTKAARKNLPHLEAATSLKPKQTFSFRDSFRNSLTRKKTKQIERQTLEKERHVRKYLQALFECASKNKLLKDGSNPFLVVSKTNSFFEIETNVLEEE